MNTNITPVEWDRRQVQRRVQYHGIRKETDQSYLEGQMRQYTFQTRLHAMQNLFLSQGPVTQVMTTTTSQRVCRIQSENDEPWPGSKC